MKNNSNSKGSKLAIVPPPPPKIPSARADPPNTVLVSLLVYNGWPFADHWEYFAAAPWGSSGTFGGWEGRWGEGLQAAGAVGGFWLEVQRGWSLLVDNYSGSTGGGFGSIGGGGGSRMEGERGKAKVVPLAWVSKDLFVTDYDGGGDDRDEGGNMRRVF
ncbi:hypothetical protein VTI74DRAFT_3409 [Chaetomium olivicolor]